MDNNDPVSMLTSDGSNGYTIMRSVTDGPESPMLISHSGKYRLILPNSNGNLSIYDNGTNALVWSLGKNSATSPYALALDQSGNISLTGGGNTTIWTQTVIPGSVGPFKLHLTDAGVLTLYDGSNKAQWSSTMVESYEVEHFGGSLMALIYLILTIILIMFVYKKYS